LVSALSKSANHPEANKKQDNAADNAAANCDRPHGCRILLAFLCSVIIKKITVFCMPKLEGLAEFLLNLYLTKYSKRD